MYYLQNVCVCKGEIPHAPSRYPPLGRAAPWACVLPGVWWAEHYPGWRSCARPSASAALCCSGSPGTGSLGTLMSEEEHKKFVFCFHKCLPSHHVQRTCMSKPPPSGVNAGNQNVIFRSITSEQTTESNRRWSSTDSTATSNCRSSHHGNRWGRDDIGITYREWKPRRNRVNTNESEMWTVLCAHCLKVKSLHACTLTWLHF